MRFKKFYTDRDLEICALGQKLYSDGPGLDHAMISYQNRIYKLTSRVRSLVLVGKSDEI